MPYIRTFLLIALSAFVCSVMANSNNHLDDMLLKKYMGNRTQFTNQPTSLGDYAFMLPKPSGPYYVGTKTYYWVEHGNAEPFTKKAYDFRPSNQTDKFREISVKVYYPSDTQPPYLSHYDPAASMDKSIALTATGLLCHQSYINSYAQAHVSMNKVYSYEFPDLPISKQQNNYPVILLLPGYNLEAGGYTIVSEELASQGYIVVALNNNFISQVVKYSGGRTLLSTIPNHGVSPLIEKTVYKDAVFAIQHLTQLQQENASLPMNKQGPIINKMDLNRLGVLGHSMGAMVSVMLSHHAEQLGIKVGIALDAPSAWPTIQYKKYGMPLYYAWNKGFSVPFLHIHSTAWPANNLTKGKNYHFTPDMYLVKIDPKPKDYPNDQFYHLGFTDNLWFNDLQLIEKYSRQGCYEAHTGNITPKVGVTLTNEYVTQFFDHWFYPERKTQIYDDLEKNNSPYPFIKVIS